MLSERIRPNVEAAPWVVEEVKKLEAEIKRLHSIIFRADMVLESWSCLPAKPQPYRHRCQAPVMNACDEVNKAREILAGKESGR